MGRITSLLRDTLIVVLVSCIGFFADGGIGSSGRADDAR
jgi:hypothetical protein